ncbi:unnamed protein product [Dovyalis caffra]|uniref:Uncharacterized protein n=1 Tax=Dovyalis caffra TaxID=77055 RepID=A0AAV1QS20_9ROSI|nr:unnamed protein product [Dovyalis caffra]
MRGKGVRLEAEFRFGKCLRVGRVLVLSLTFKTLFCPSGGRSRRTFKTRYSSSNRGRAPCVRSD